MPINKDEQGRRWVQAEIEVPGTPEEVWQAIATGPGISSWFVPYTVEGHVGGKTIGHFGEDASMDSIATITAWEAPHRFVAESKDLGEDAPTIATEWSVEAQSGDTCIVRVVHSLFATTDDWDEQLQGWEYGWPIFFKMLTLVLTHFRGQPCSYVQLVAVSGDSRPDAWKQLMGSLGIAAPVVGGSIQSTSGAPPLKGTAVEVGPVEYPENLTVLTTEPASGIATLTVHEFETAMIFVRFYLFGDNVEAIGAAQRPVWQAWLDQHVTPVAAPHPA